LGELLNGIFRDAPREGVRRLIEDLMDKAQIEAVVLAGTELPLLIRADTLCGLPLLDTTELHVRVIVQRLSPGGQEPATLC
jgi:aspartate/glutamate racemase